MRKSTLSLVSGAALALTLGAPRRADAQPQRYCAPGVLGACFNLEVVESDAGAVVRVQNLQGSIGDVGSDWFTLENINVTLVTPDLWWPLVIDPSAAVDAFVPEGPASRLSGNVLDGGDNLRLTLGGGAWTPGLVPYDGFWTTFIEGHPFVGFGFAGCTLPGSDFVASTCPRDGFDGWLEIPLEVGLYDQTTGEYVRATRPSDILVGAWGISGGAGELQEFRLVPEPASFALLGTGLLGLGGLAVNRRRRS